MIKAMAPKCKGEIDGAGGRAAAIRQAFATPTAPVRTVAIQGFELFEPQVYFEPELVDLETALAAAERAFR